MKKLTYLFLALLIVACSSDDSSSNDNNDNNNTINTLLVVKRTRDTDTYQREYNYTYAGTQIISQIRETIRDNYTDIETTTFIYTNNVITMLNSTTERDGEFQNVNTSTFEYDEFDRKIKENRIDEEGNILFYITYSYLDNGSVQVIYDDRLQSIYNYDDLGRLYEIINYDEDGQPDGGQSWTFDDKNSPYKNVTTWHPRSFLTASNFINYIETNDFYGCLYEYNTTYNDDNYPISVEITNCDGEITTETFEYINL